MERFIRPKPGLVLNSSHVVRTLDLHGPRYACGSCGSKMFVKYDSGLCPLCFNRAQRANNDVSAALGDVDPLEGEELAAE
jgi:hypothetical protein